MKHFATSLLTIVMSFNLIGAAESANQSPQPDVKWLTKTLLRSMPSTDQKNGGSEITVTESITSVRAEIFTNDPVTLLWGSTFKNVFLSGNTSSIDLPAMLVAREMPFGAEFDVPFLDEDGYRLGVLAVPSYYTDSWEDSFNDFETGAFRWMSEYWIRIPGSERFSLKGGLRHKPEHDINIVPIIDLYYQFNDRWAFHITSEDGGIIYTVNEKTKLFTEYRYSLDEYEISQNGQPGRVLLHRQNNAGVGISYQFATNWTVTSSTGVAFNRKFAFESAPFNNDQFEESIYFSLGLKGQF